MKIIYKILIFLGIIKEKPKKEKEIQEETIYISKPIMTDYEYKFYQMIKVLEDKYIIIPQLNLASVVKK